MTTVKTKAKLIGNDTITVNILFQAINKQINKLINQSINHQSKLTEPVQF